MLVSLAISAYLLALIFVYFTQRSFMYHPPVDYFTPEQSDVPTMEEVPLSFKVHGKEITITGWWAAPQDNKPVVMVFHGNGSSIYSNWFIYRTLMENGYGVWGVSYPGYPGATGKPTQANLVEATKRQYEAILKRDIGPDQIVFYGTSLGAAVATQLSDSHEPASLVLEAPFTSMVDMGRKLMPIFPVSLLMKDKWRSDAVLKDKSMPLIWTHGTDDRVIPVQIGQRLYDDYEGPKSAHIFQGGTHANIWISGGREVLLEALQTIE